MRTVFSELSRFLLLLAVDNNRRSEAEIASSLAPLPPTLGDRAFAGGTSPRAGLLLVCPGRPNKLSRVRRRLLRGMPPFRNQ